MTTLGTGRAGWVYCLGMAMVWWEVCLHLGWGGHCGSGVGTCWGWGVQTRSTALACWDGGHSTSWAAASGDCRVGLGLGVSVLLVLGGLSWVNGVGLGWVLVLALAKIDAGFSGGFFIFWVCLNLCNCRVLGVSGGFMHGSNFFLGFFFFNGVWVSNVVVVGLVGAGFGFLLLVVFWMPKSVVFIRCSLPSILTNSFQVLVGLVGLGTFLANWGLGRVGWVVLAVGIAQVGWGWVVLAMGAAHAWPGLGTGWGVLAGGAAPP